MGAPVVLGLDFGGSKIATAVADLSGRRLASRSVQTDASLGANRNLERGVSSAKALLSEVAAGSDLVSVGACTFGIPATNEIRLAPAIPGWGDLSLGLELAAAFGTRAVRVATDVKAAAKAEAGSGALAGHDPALYVNLGTGLAIAIVCGGKVVSGANGAAGEIAYCLRQPADLELARADRAVLEEVVSGMALSATALRLTGEELTAAEIFSAEDLRLSAAIDDFVRELSFQLVNIAVALDPSRIAVGGGMTRSWPRLEGPLRAALDANVPYPPELVLGAYPFDAALVGAIALGIEAAAAGLGDGRRDSPGGDGPNGRRGSQAQPPSDSAKRENSDRSEDRGRV
ncbi:MAG TPA: ROK family protein [Acidimicrobiales bacterium]|nr:ROK family protein [Acidimicrobiales bacterium]